MFDTKIIVLDPEHEYKNFAKMVVNINFTLAPKLKSILLTRLMFMKKVKMN